MEVKSMEIKEYIVGIIAVAVYLVCFILHSIKFFDNRWLPLVAGALGIIFNVWYSRGFSFGIFVCGLASGLSATGIDQAISFFTKPFIEKKGEDDENKNDEE